MHQKSMVTIEKAHYSLGSLVSLGKPHTDRTITAGSKCPYFIFIKWQPNHHYNNYIVVCPKNIELSFDSNLMVYKKTKKMIGLNKPSFNKI